MEKTNITKRGVFASALLFSALALLLSLPEPTYAQARMTVDETRAQPIQGIQVAHGGYRYGHKHWDRGYRPYGYIYYGPGYNPYYWGGWYNFHRGGAFCKKQCLRSRRTGEIIRCRVRCY